MYKMLANVQAKFYTYVAYGFLPCLFGLQVVSLGAKKEYECFRDTLLKLRRLIKGTTQNKLKERKVFL